METEKKVTQHIFEGTQLLKEALQNAEMLLSHASEHGIEVERKHIETIIRAKQLDDNNRWYEEAEINFWTSYEHISRQLKPVNIDSLHAAMESPIHKKRWYHKLFNKTVHRSLTNKAVTYYTILALFSMLIMLTVQIYSLKGTTLLSTIKWGNDRMTEIEERLSQLMLITEDHDSNRSAFIEKDRLETQQQEIAETVDSSTELLAQWLEPATLPAPPKSTPKNWL